MLQTTSSTIQPVLPTLNFHLPPELEAGQPPEARGLPRDHVRLMVSHYSDNTISHARFYQLADYLEAGDVLVINTSATLKAAVPGRRRAAGMPVTLHFSTQLAADLWVVELRRGNDPFLQAQTGETVDLPAGGTAVLLAPYHRSHKQEDFGPGPALGAPACGWPGWPYRSPCWLIWMPTVRPFATAMSLSPGRLPITRPCTPTNRAARRCHRQGVPLRRS